MSKKFWLVAALSVTANVGGVRAQDSLWSLSMRELFRVADAHNTSIKSLENAVQVAREGESVARAARLPDADAQLSVSYLGNGRLLDRDFGAGKRVAVPHLGNNLALRAQWAVYTGGAIRSGIRMAHLQTEMSRADVKSGTQDVRMMLAGLYLQLHSLQNRQNVYEEHIALTEELIAQTRQRTAEGVALKNDITRQQLQLEGLQLSLARLRAEESIVNHQLLTALGGQQTVRILTAAAFENIPSDRHAEESWQSEAAQSAPALEQSALSISLSRERERMERSALLPNVALVVEDHLDGPITFEIPNLDKNFNYWYVGVGLKYNFGALWKDRCRLRQARAATRAAQSRHAVVLEQVENAIQAGYTRYTTACATMDMHRTSVRLARENHRVMEARYIHGLVLVTDLTDASNALLNARLALENARIDVMFHYCALEHLAGTLGEQPVIQRQ